MSQNFNELIQNFQQTDEIPKNSYDSFSNQDYFENYNESYTDHFKDQPDVQIIEDSNKQIQKQEKNNDKEIDYFQQENQQDEYFNFEDDQNQDYFKQSSEEQFKVPEFNNDNSVQKNSFNNSLQEESQQNESIQDDEYIENLKMCLKKIFAFYSSFGKRISNDKMNLSQFHKLCQDANLIDQNLDSQQIQLCFIGVNKIQINLPYEKFPRLLHSLSNIKYNFENPNDNFAHLIEKNLMPLFNLIYTQTDMGTIDKIIRQKFQFSLLSLIYLMRNYFFHMYKKFFVSEIKNFVEIKKEKLMKKSKEDLMKFLRDFEILPGLTSINTICEFYTAVMNIDFDDHSLNYVKDLRKILDEDHGKVFTFHRFVFFIQKISVFIFNDPNNIPKKFRLLNFTNEEKFYMLLERMEISSGFFDLSIRKSKKNQTPRLTLPHKTLADLHKETGQFPNFEQYLNDKEESSWMLLNFDINIKTKNQKDYLYQKLNMTKTRPSTKKSKTPKKETYQFSEDFLKAINIYKNDLKKIFTQYSSNKNTNKQNSMNSFQFIRFLRDCKIVRGNGETQNIEATLMTKEADIIFTQLTHFNHFKVTNEYQLKHKNYEKIEIQNYINFKGFLKGFEIIVQKLYPSMQVNKGIDTLFYLKISKNLFKQNVKNEEKSKTLTLTTEKINQQEEYIKFLSQNLLEQEMIDILSLIHQFMSPRFFVYTHGKNFMRGGEFFEFLKDFGIFPQILSKMKIEAIFQALSQVYFQNPEKQKIEDDVIDNNIFVESILLIVHGLKLNIKEEPIELMQESEGNKKLSQTNTTIKRGDIFQKLRIQRPDYFLMQLIKLIYQCKILQSKIYQITSKIILMIKIYTYNLFSNKIILLKNILIKILIILILEKNLLLFLLIKNQFKLLTCFLIVKIQNLKILLQLIMYMMMEII